LRQKWDGRRRGWAELVLANRERGLRLQRYETEAQHVIEMVTPRLDANAVVLPITGWLSAHLGRRNYFLLSITVFRSFAMKQGVSQC
jgi:hypothetical protein